MGTGGLDPARSWTLQSSQAKAGATLWASQSCEPKTPSSGSCPMTPAFSLQNPEP